MPELPEVETIVRNFRPGLLGRRIVGFRSLWPKGVSPPPGRLRRAIVGRTITDVTRRGKFIVLALDDGGWLLVHLRMSGRFEWLNGEPPSPGPALRAAINPRLARRGGAGSGSCSRDSDAPPVPSLEGSGVRHVRATLGLDDGTLAFCDARKFGRILYTRDLAGATAELGPEPLARGFTAERLAGLLRGRRRQLKPLLLDQRVLAGLGNIYTDEALFRAGLHPLCRSDRLSDAQIRRLHAAVRAVLRLAIRNHGTSIDWAYPGGWMQRKLAVYGRAGEPCRACGTPIVGLRVGQRGTHICPRCQPKS